MMEALRILKILDVAPAGHKVALWVLRTRIIRIISYVEKYLVDPDTKEHNLIMTDLSAILIWITLR